MSKIIYSLFTLIVMVTTFAHAGGYATDDVYLCTSNNSKFEFSIGATSKVTLTGAQVGTCEGAGYISGGNMRDCFGSAKLFQDKNCSANFSLSWVGCFAPKKNFNLVASSFSNSQTTFNCERIKKGGSYYMDGSRR